MEAHLFKVGDFLSIIRWIDSDERKKKVSFFVFYIFSFFYSSVNHFRFTNPYRNICRATFHSIIMWRNLIAYTCLVYVRVTCLPKDVKWFIISYHLMIQKDYQNDLNWTELFVFYWNTFNYWIQYNIVNLLLNSICNLLKTIWGFWSAEIRMCDYIATYEKLNNLFRCNGKYVASM